jgi:hypothetical protein
LPAHRCAYASPQDPERVAWRSSSSRRSYGTIANIGAMRRSTRPLFPGSSSPRPKCWGPCASIDRHCSAISADSAPWRSAAATKADHASSNDGAASCASSRRYRSISLAVHFGSSAVGSASLFSCGEFVDVVGFGMTTQSYRAGRAIAMRPWRRWDRDQKVRLDKIGASLHSIVDQLELVSSVTFLAT